MADKLRQQQQLEALQARHVGTGHADTTKHEWISNIHRDTKASIIGHPAMLQYTALGMGEHPELTRIRLLEEMIRPCGPPPAEEIEEKRAKEADKERSGENGTG